MGLSNVSFLSEWSVLGFLTTDRIEDGPHKVGQSLADRQPSQIFSSDLWTGHARTLESNPTLQTQYLAAGKFLDKKS